MYIAPNLRNKLYYTSTWKILSSYNVPGIVLGTGDTAVTKTGKDLYLQGPHILVEIAVSCRQSASIQMKKRTYLYFKSICCSCEIQIQLGVLCFYLLNLAALPVSVSWMASGFLPSVHPVNSSHFLPGPSSSSH